MDKIKLLEIVANMAEKESDRTWNRFSIMLTVNTGLIALVTLIGKDYYPLSPILGSIFGIILSIIWYKMIPISKYYEKRWHEDMIAIINSDDTIKEFIKGRSDLTSRVKRPTKKSASSFAKIIPVILLFLWIIIGVISFINLLSLKSI